MSQNLDSYIRAYGEDFAYAFDNAIMLNWYPKRIMALSKKEDKVLELGLGHGYTSNLFAQFYSHYSVIDGSSSVIAQFRKQYPSSSARIVHALFEEYDTAERFDVVVMGFVLEHVDNPQQVLRHFRQFLAPGGRCFIAVPNAESLHRRFGHEAGLLPELTALGEGDKALGHMRLYTVSSLSQELDECGYRVVAKEGIFLKPFTTRQIASLDLSVDVLDGMCKVGVGYPELSAALLFQTELQY
jgi:2-polyprenyl-3-methyl-5-hydroxy-6-metoxy-1,4-benzoquinol methylase